MPAQAVEGLDRVVDLLALNHDNAVVTSACAAILAEHRRLTEGAPAPLQLSHGEEARRAARLLERNKAAGQNPESH
jgi:hypothetical protein